MLLMLLRPALQLVDHPMWQKLSFRPRSWKPELISRWELPAIRSREKTPEESDNSRHPLVLSGVLTGLGGI